MNCKYLFSFFFLQFIFGKKGLILITITILKIYKNVYINEGFTLWLLFLDHIKPFILLLLPPIKRQAVIMFLEQLYTLSTVDQSCFLHLKVRASYKHSANLRDILGMLTNPAANVRGLKADLISSAKL